MELSINKISWFLVEMSVILFYCFGGIMVLGTSCYLPVLVLIVLLGFIEDRGSFICTDKNQKRFIVLILLSIINILFVTLFNNLSPINTILLNVCLLVLSYTISKKDDVNNLIMIIVVCTTISSLFSVLEGLNVPLAINIWKVLNPNVYLPIDERTLGLSQSIIEYAYCGIQGLPFALFFRPKSKIGFFFKYSSVIIIIGGIIMNNTRSSIVCLGITLFVYFFLREKKNYFLIFILIVGISGLLVINPVEKLFINTRFTESRLTDNRIPMFLTGFNHLTRYPFGMGEYHPDSDLVISFGSIAAYECVMSNSAHNFLANIAGSYGIQGLVLMLLIIKNIFSEAISKVKKSLSDETIAIILCIIFSFLSACLHNLYLFSGDFMLWVSIGLLFGKNRLSNN